MALSDLIYLPTPVSSNRFSLGALVSNPLVADSETIFLSSDPSLQPFEATQVSKPYKSTVTCIGEVAREDTLNVEAEEMTFRHLAQAQEAFESLCQNRELQSLLSEKATAEAPIYFVTGIQELRNASLASGRPSEVTSDDVPTFTLPIHVRRDSGMGTTQENSLQVFGIEVREVRAKVGSPLEPHTTEDIGFSWSYISMSEDSQLSIGLGNTVKSREPSKSEVEDDAFGTEEEFGFIVEL